MARQAVHPEDARGDDDSDIMPEEEDEGEDDFVRNEDFDDELQ